MAVIAQQIIDASGEQQGGLAFIAFTILVVAITASLFYMDRVRTRRERESRDV